MTDWSAEKTRDILETVRLGHNPCCPLTGERSVTGWDRTRDNDWIARLMKADDGKELLDLMSAAIRSTAIFESSLPLYH